MRKLLYWLGPWVNQSKSPTGIKREAIMVQDDFPMWVYSSERRTGAMFVIPGIHYEGPADIRLDRFARVLANSGMVVGVPFLPSMLNLVMSPNLLLETRLAFRHFHQHIGQKCGVFSISAASIAALDLAAHDELSGCITRAMMFGGFSDWSAALLFAMSGELENGEKLAVDPLNLPVIFLNLLDKISAFSENSSSFEQYLREFICSTWEKEEMSKPEQYVPLAEQLALHLPDDLRSLYLQACGVIDGGQALIKEALSKTDSQLDWLNPLPLLQKVKVPLHIAHGKDDVVVPWTQSVQLSQSVPEDQSHWLHLTGLYHHTGVTGVARLLRLLPLLPIELYHSIGLVRGMYETGRFERPKKS